MTSSTVTHKKEALKKATFLRVIFVLSQDVLERGQGDVQSEDLDPSHSISGGRLNGFTLYFL